MPLGAMIREHMCLDFPYLRSPIGLAPFHPHIGVMLRARALNRTIGAKAQNETSRRLALLLSAIIVKDMGR